MNRLFPTLSARKSSHIARRAAYLPTSQWSVATDVHRYCNFILFGCYLFAAVFVDSRDLCLCAVNSLCPVYFIPLGHIALLFTTLTVASHQPILVGSTIESHSYWHTRINLSYTILHSSSTSVAAQSPSRKKCRHKKRLTAYKTDC